jgi:hypothetical protein
MCKCQIQWIDSKGEPTPDKMPAIARAVCHDPQSFGEKGSEPFLICVDHAERKTKFWKLLPLEGQEMKDAHNLVQRDHREFKIIPDVVRDSIKKSFPDQAKDIIASLRWSGDHFSFTRWGMYVGVELDGYIHT